MYRCLVCDGVYNLYSSTVFQQKQFTPAQVVLLLRGVYQQGTPTAQLAREIGLSYPTVLSIRHALQSNVQAMQPDSPLADAQTETDEMFQNAGEKVTNPNPSDHPDAVPTSARDGAPMPMTDRRLLVQWDGRAVK